MAWCLGRLPFRRLSLKSLIGSSRPCRVDEPLHPYHLRQSDIAVAHGAETGRLLRELLRTATAIQYDTRELLALAYEAFDHGAHRDDLLVVAEHMVRWAIEMDRHRPVVVRQTDDLAIEHGRPGPKD